MSSTFTNKKITNLHSIMLQGNNLKIIHARVMVLRHEKLSECALQQYEVSLKYL